MTIAPDLYSTAKVWRFSIFLGFYTLIKASICASVRLFVPQPLRYSLAHMGTENLRIDFLRCYFRKNRVDVFIQCRIRLLHTVPQNR